MPVITRSQAKRMQENIPIAPCFEEENEMSPGLKSFVSKLKPLLYQSSCFNSNSHKLKLCLKIFQIIHDEIGEVIKSADDTRTSMKFMNTVVKKIDQFIYSYITGKYDDLNKSEVNEFMKLIEETRKIVISIASKNAAYSEYQWKFPHKTETRMFLYA